MTTRILKKPLFVALLLSAPAVHAGEIDFAQMTCATYVQKVQLATTDTGQRDTVDMIHLWLLGYASARAGLTTLSGDVATRFGGELGSQCGADPQLTMTRAAESAMQAALAEAT